MKSALALLLMALPEPTGPGDGFITRLGLKQPVPVA